MRQRPSEPTGREAVPAPGYASKVALAVWVVAALGVALTTHNELALLSTLLLGGLIIPSLAKLLLRARGYNADPWSWKW